MAITPSIILPSPAFIQTGQAAQVGLTIANTEATSIRISGIDLLDTNGIFVAGDAIPGVPVRYDIYASGSTTGSSIPIGTPVIASVPAWGTATQSNIIYYPGNVSGSTWSIASNSGSYGGGSGSAAQPNWVEIPAGSTGYFTFGVSSNLSSDLSGSALASFYVGNIQAKIQVSGSSVPLSTTGTNSLYLITGKVKGVELAPISSPSLIVKNTFARNSAYLPPVWAAGTSAGFDVATQTTLTLEDNRKIDITYWNIQNNFTSSAPSTISVVQSGAYTSTPVNSALTNSVGAIYGGQNTQLSGGAGALTLAGLNGTAGLVIDSATISNRLAAGLTGSMTIGLTNKVPLYSYLVPVSSQYNYKTGIISAQTLRTFVVFNDGTSEECTIANGWVNTFSCADSGLVLNVNSGYSYWNGTRPANIVVSCVSTKAAVSLTCGAPFTCTYTP
jgi:hypothetical protein